MVLGGLQAEHPRRRFCITAAEKLENGLLLSFTSQAAYHYNVQARTNLATGDWMNVVTNIPSGGTLTQSTVTNATIDPQQFYRIQQSP
jgi:hypothetical protein